MSTILDALKRVEEQLRNEAGRKPGAPAVSADTRGDAESLTVLEGDDEARQVYLSLVDLIARIEERVQTAQEQAREESGAALVEMVNAIKALRDDIARQQETLHEQTAKNDAERKAGQAALVELRQDLASQRETYELETRQRNAECKAGEAALAAAQSEIIPLKKTLGETQKSLKGLAESVKGLQNEFAQQQDSIRHMVEEQGAAREAGAAALTATQAQLHAEVQGSALELAKAVATLRKNFELQGDAIRKMNLQRDAERDSALTALASTQSQCDTLKKALIETREGVVKLVHTADRLQKDLAAQTETAQKETKQRDLEREAGKKAMAAIQSQLDPLKNIVAEIQSILPKLVKATESLQKDLTAQREASQKESRQRDAQVEAQKTAEDALQSQLEVLKNALAENQEGLVRAARAVVALQQDSTRLRETLRNDGRQRDSERETDRAVLAGLKSRVDVLQQLADDTETDTGLDAGRQERMAQDEGASKGVMDRAEVQRLHLAAGEAFSRKDFAEALRQLDIIDAAFPNNKSILYNRAQCLIFLKRNDEARSLCDYLATELGYAPASELKKSIKD